MLGVSDLLYVLLVFSILLVLSIVRFMQYIWSVRNDLIITVHILQMCKQYMPLFVMCMVRVVSQCFICYFVVLLVEVLAR